MKNKEKLRPFDELIFYSIGKRRPEIMEEFHKMANINPGWFNVTEIEEIDLSEYVKQR